ncbi:MAG: hypothetical protein HN535_01265 [Flavobacteriales bacterium]|jgi:hypothetical protein|nr:hypothetical protein [Flavobacteriales bacterium]
MKGFLFLFSFLIITSCTKIEDVLVGGNTHPTDLTIENTVIENYVNKLYISTIGREPNPAEFDANFETLRTANLSQESREEVISAILNKEEYYNNLFKLESANILNGVDTAMINERYYLYKYFLMNSTGFDSIYIAYEFERLAVLKQALPDLNAETITNTELYERMVNNIFFDEINMGTENFVVAMFQNFMLRYPTTAELESGKLMVNDNNSTLFFIAGNGKNDFINIFFASDEYYTGQTNILFNRYLFRNPTSEESVNYSLDYLNTDDYKVLQKRILSTDEFIGL